MAGCSLSSKKLAVILVVGLDCASMVREIIQQLRRKDAINLGFIDEERHVLYHGKRCDPTVNSTNLKDANWTVMDRWERPSALWSSRRKHAMG